MYRLRQQCYAYVHIHAFMNMDIHSFCSAVALLYPTHSGFLIQICETAAQTRTNQNDSSFNLKLLSIVLILHT